MVSRDGDTETQLFMSKFIRLMSKETHSLSRRRKQLMKDLIGMSREGGAAGVTHLSITQSPQAAPGVRRELGLPLM